MTGKIISVCNMKGGVGKTTLVVGLAETLAAGATGQKLKVLVLDLDAQAHASYCILGDDFLAQASKGGRTIETFFKSAFLETQAKHLNDFIRPNASSMTSGGKVISLSLVPASTELRHAEREIIYQMTQSGVPFELIEGKVRDLVAGEVSLLRRAYDVIIIDCPPGISIFTEAALKASDLVIAPVVMDTFSKLGLTAFCKRILSAPKRSQASKLPWVLANRVQSTKVSDRILEELEAEAAASDPGFRLFKTRILQSAALVKAMACEDKAPTYAIKYDTARAMLQELATEILEVINAHRPTGRDPVPSVRDASRPLLTEARGVP